MNARKQRYGSSDLATLFEGATRIVASRGKSHADVDLADPEQLAKKVLGPSGNLRAPSARVGRTWLVGFSEDGWTSVLG